MSRNRLCKWPGCVAYAYTRDHCATHADRHAALDHVRREEERLAEPVTRGEMEEALRELRAEMMGFLTR